MRANAADKHYKTGGHWLTGRLLLAPLLVVGVPLPVPVSMPVAKKSKSVATESELGEERAGGTTLITSAQRMRREVCNYILVFWLLFF